jgi:transcriptional regulator with XRE-family HTH domain
MSRQKRGVRMKRIIDAEVNNITGKRIKKARIKAGLSQNILSVRLETMAVYVCRGSVSRIENGARTVTDIEIDAISKVLNVSLDELFGRG